MLDSQEALATVAYVAILGFIFTLTMSIISFMYYRRLLRDYLKLSDKYLNELKETQFWIKVSREQLRNNGRSNLLLHRAAGNNMLKNILNNKKQ